MFIGRSILFLILNFAALGLGALFTSKGVSSDWYQNLLKAPWTPAGWVFGFAWSTIMVCFAFYMAKLFELVSNRKMLISLYVFQWILNVSWNPAFFYHHKVILGLIIIIALSTLISYFLFRFLKQAKLYSILVLPYFVWLLIATSLNAYIFFYN